MFTIEVDNPIEKESCVNKEGALVSQRVKGT